MSTDTADEKIRVSLINRLEEARYRTDQLFQLLDPKYIYNRPIPERHRIIFYLGHLEAFDWNLIARGQFNQNSFDKELDELFSLGIDPPTGNSPSDNQSDWPPLSKIVSYNERTRKTLDQLLSTNRMGRSTENGLENESVFNLAIEHRLMHAETLAYMYHWLPLKAKQTPHSRSNSLNLDHVEPLQVEIPLGTATLGMRAGNGFGWDNEFDLTLIEVPRFKIGKYNITNAQFMQFVQADCYNDQSLWSDDAWKWITRENIQHPRFWNQLGENWVLLNMFDERPLPPSWPVYVSHAEASAYAKWIGQYLPTEGQFHRAAYGTPSGLEQLFPWGNHGPEKKHGNFDFSRWNPTPVGSHPEGNSAFGVSDLLGNGWEWTSTLFEPFEGFKQCPIYPGYSTDFFDGNHYVMKGGSSRTASCMLRRSFRNWFRPHYPQIYASFRCVDS